MLGYLYPGSSYLGGRTTPFPTAQYLVCQPGSFAFTGTDASLRQTVYRLTCAPGSFTFTGTAATLVHLTLSTVRVFIGGVNRSSNVRLGSLEVEDVLNDAPNRCTFTCADLVPAEGSVVSVMRGPSSELEFAGHIISSQEFYEGIVANIAHFVTCTDYTWKLDRRLITKRWVNQTATTIAEEIISGFTTGFTDTNVVAGLATIPEFECEEEEPSRALSRLAAEVGGSWYVDYELDLHFFITEATDTPEDISDATLATTTARGLTHLGDLSQVRTRERGTGAGSSLLENIIHTLPSFPLETVAMFETAGGSFRSSKGPNIGAYTGKHDGGVAATVLGNSTSGATPGSAPSVAVAANVVGGLAGEYRYKVAFGNGQGETLPSSASSPVTGVAFAAPAAASVAATSSVVGVLVGVYLYVVTYVTALGETTAGTQFGRTAVKVSAPGAVSLAEVASTMGRLQGQYGYRVTFKTPYGESEAGNDTTRTCNEITGPGAPTVNAATANGPLKGTYKWKYSYVDEWGNEAPGTATGTQTLSATTATAPALSGNGTGNSIRIRVAWRSKWGESNWSDSTTDADHGAVVVVTPTGFPADCTEWVMFSTGSYVGAAPSQYYRMPEIYTGSGAGDLIGNDGSPVSSGGGTMGVKVPLTLGNGPTGVVKKRIYRTKNGAGTDFYLVGEVAPSTTSFTDDIPDEALVVLAPSVNRTGRQHTITNISTGPTGTTGRVLWRTKSGGAIHYKLAEIPDNATTSWTDNAPDEALGGESLPSPTVNTAGGESHSLSSIPVGPTGTVARRIYRSPAGVAGVFKFAGELSDNVTTTFVDNLRDAELGHSVPLVNTAGANKIAVTSIPTGGSGITKRILYRTEAGGALYKYVATLDDNVATSYTDNTPDTSLGREALTQSTIGAIPGDTSLLLSTVVGWPTAGWLKAGSQLIRWTGISGGALTGIPGARAVTLTRSGTTATATTTGAHGFTSGEVVTIQGAVESAYNGARTVTVTGATTFTFTVAGAPTTPATGTITVSAVGAILANISGDGAGVVTAPFLSGVTGLTYPMEKGAPVRIYVVRNDTAAQTALAALEGGDGIHEAPLDDPSLVTVAALSAACDAELEAWSTKLRTVTFKSRDPLLRSGKTLTLDLGSPVDQAGEFLIQRVISTEFDTAAELMPMRDVIAAPVRLSFQDVIRRARNTAA